MKTLLLIFILVASHAFAAPVDPSRPFLDHLLKRNHVNSGNYIFPYLITETASVMPFDRDETLRRLNAYWKKTALPFRGHFSKSGIPLNSGTESKFTLPVAAVSGDQLDGIQKCSAKYCKMKLNTEHEKTLMESAKGKAVEYRSLVLARLRRYLVFNELWGYEGTFQNQDSVNAMIQDLPFLASHYPLSSSYLEKGFWAKAAPISTGPLDSLLREEVVSMNLNPLQPILRLVEDLHFKESGRDLFFEIHIYTDHYFDASCRTYEILPWGKDKKQSVLIVSDVMNIDELAKSNFVRMLYSGKMQNAVSDYQDEEISRLKGD